MMKIDMKSVVSRLRTIACALPVIAMPCLAQDLPEGKGKDTVERVCSLCHESANIIYHGNAKKADWAFLVDDMISRGAKATPEDVQAINSYLTKNFGLVNINTAPAAEIAELLEISPADAEAIVSYRTEHGKFQTLADLKKVTALASVDLTPQKKRISF